MGDHQVIIQPTAIVSKEAQIGGGTRIWHFVQIREKATIGQNCILGKDVYVDFEVKIGNNVKIENGALIYHGVTIEDGVFIGPDVCFTNDKIPRAITPDGRLKSAEDWEVSPTVVRYGASVGAGSVVLPNVIIGQFALVGAGSVVTRSVPDHGLVIGNPARMVGYVCKCGRKLEKQADVWYCSKCDWTFEPQKG